MNFQPVIIIGAPRSGTNMLRDVLARLADFETWPCDEINFVWKHGNLSHEGDDLHPSQIKSRTRRYVGSQFRRIAEKSGARFVVEKTCANSVRVPFVDDLVPRAKYLFLLRNGRDAIASTIKRWQAPTSDLGYLIKKFRFVAPSDRIPVLANAIGKRFGNSGKRKEMAWKTWGPVFPELLDAVERGRPLAEICAIQWAYCVKRSLADLEILGRSRWLPISYENFVNAPDRELGRIMKYLDRESSPSELAAATLEVRPGSVGKFARSLEDEDLELIDSFIANSGIKQEYEFGS